MIVVRIAPLWIVLAAIPLDARQLAPVEGLVLDTAGGPAAAAIVALVDGLGAVLAARETDAGGRFVFSGMPAGRYTLRVTMAGAEPVHLPLLVDAVPVHVTVRFPAQVTDRILVEGSHAGDPSASRAGIAGESLQRIPVRNRALGLQGLLATLPGWSSEDNGLLHTRGVDDGLLFVIDGVPVYERLDLVSGLAPDLSSVAAVHVITGFVPPEFGYKSGGIVEVRSRTGERQWTGQAELGRGSDAMSEAAVNGGGSLGPGMTLRAEGLAYESDRFLDPVHPDNLHNRGQRTATSGRLSWSGDAQLVTTGWGAGRSRFDVPNSDEQDESGQDQRQHVSARHVTLSWQRASSAGTLAHAAVYRRHTTNALIGSAFDTPITAEASRRLARTGMLASVARELGHHVLKGGVEAQRLGLDERFLFAVTDRDEAIEADIHDEALAYDRSRPFVFAGTAEPWLWSAYLQDSWHVTPNATVSGGLRFDRSRLLLPRHAWSPRVGTSYRVDDRTVLRGALSRFFQPPQPEHLLLSSSAEARALSPFSVGDHEGGADLEPERQWAVEAGVEREVATRVRIDAAYWRRWVQHAADPNVFFGTTIIFPNAVAKGRAQGVDLRVEVPQRRGWSGYASVSLAHVVQTGPITGGLFLEDEVEEIGPGVEFTPDHDQRVAAAAGATWQHASSALALAITLRYESGTPLQREDDDDLDELAERAGAEYVDFVRGRVRPRTVVSMLATAPVFRSGRVAGLLRAQVLNLFDHRHAYNFGNPFSGTHFGAPRTASLSLQLRFQ